MESHFLYCGVVCITVPFSMLSMACVPRLITRGKRLRLSRYFPQGPHPLVTRRVVDCLDSNSQVMVDYRPHRKAPKQKVARQPCSPSRPGKFFKPHSRFLWGREHVLFVCTVAIIVPTKHTALLNSRVPSASSHTRLQHNV